VNAIAPGIFPSEMVPMDDPENMLNKIVSSVPAGRTGRDTVSRCVIGNLSLGSCWSGVASFECCGIVYFREGIFMVRKY
jgi:hypothetical protein